MARWFGKIGFGESVETNPGVWVNEIVEFSYYGDTEESRRSYRNGEKTVKDVSVSDSISVVSDPYILAHFSNIVYITYMGVKWQVESAVIRYPRVVMSLGDKYAE